MAAAAALAGCSAGMIADLPDPIGLPQGVPARPAEAPAFPTAVTSEPRTDRMLTEAERKKLEQELIEARDRTAASARPAAKRKRAATKAKSADPAASRREP